ncbi:MAG: MOSC domain-containing protein, partial [Phycisphaerales bacterium]|nr:MOSC domain-containing protein [Phycisphaerales bacterium]
MSHLHHAGTRGIASVVSIQIGRTAPLGPEGVASAFVKRPVSGPVRVGALGLEGDEQADLTVHGGTDKAVYLYPAEHYPRWAADVPRHAGDLVPGGFGENLTVTGLDEETVAIGDVFAVDDVLLRVTQPRQPCFKLGLRFADNTLGKIMLQTGRTGWYARVMKPGTLQTGATIARSDHPNPAWTVARFNRFLLSKRDDRAELTELAALDGLADEWK